MLRYRKTRISGHDRECHAVYPLCQYCSLRKTGSWKKKFIFQGKCLNLTREMLIATSGKKTKAILNSLQQVKCLLVTDIKSEYLHSLFRQAKFHCFFFSSLNSIYVHLCDNVSLKCVATSNSLLIFRLPTLKFTLSINEVNSLYETELTDNLCKGLISNQGDIQN